MVSNDSERRLKNALEAVQKARHENKLTAASASNIERWLSRPQYAPYRPALLELVESEIFSELNRLFWERIPFGTGGRRGPMSEFGSATINARTIAESAQGLAVYVQRWRVNSNQAQGTPRVEFANSKQPRGAPRAVVAFDSRHRSTEFAMCTASVLAANGFEVFFFPQPRSTPELSFAVRHLGCDTGVMISASHNPPSDNGFKAYWSTGGQVLPPHDAGIIECVDAAEDIPQVDFDAAVNDGRILLLGAAIDSAYVTAVCTCSLSSERDIKALYTPLHGVGETSVFRVVQQAGFKGVSIFEPQRSQDGDFPNVPDHLPNPERFAVFNPAIAEAKLTGTDLVLASDPDADRMAVAVRNKAGEFVCLTGNQLGALLTDYVLSHRALAGTLSDQHFVIETLVTTPMIAVIGAEYGVQVVREVLVGFKHIAAEIDARIPELFVFAAEESIGFMAGNYGRDKDAAIGALFVLELAAELKRQGLTLLDRLDELYMRHGYFLEETVSTMCPGPAGRARIDAIMAAFRQRPPSTVGRCVWSSVRDFEQLQLRSLPSNHVIEQILAPHGDLLIFTGDSRGCEVTVAMRPSGTEPKIKFYYFINTSVQPSLAEARERAADCLGNVKAALDQWMSEVSDS